MTDHSKNNLRKRYQRLLEVARDLAATLDFETLLEEIVSAAAELCDTEAASILLYDETKQELYCEAAIHQGGPVLRGPVVPVNGSLAGWIASNRAPILVTDAKNFPHLFKETARSMRVHPAALLGAPLIAKGKVIGALEVINKRDTQFDQDDQELLVALADHAALAIENSRHFQQSDLISELIHELRTPITSLSTAAQLLGRKEVGEELRSSIVETIQRETGRLAKMTSAYLDLARLESGRIQFQAQRFAVLPLLRECASLVQSQPGESQMQIGIDAPPHLELFSADRDKMKQVVLNLLSNAVKYNRPDGTVTITAEKEQQELVLRVIDTGIGIPEESLPYIFEKFYRVPGTERFAPGTGLGLSICKRIVEMHGGRISAHSVPDVGTTFTVVLPLDHIQEE